MDLGIRHYKARQEFGITSPVMGPEDDRGGGGYALDVADFLTSNSDVQAALAELAEKRKAFLESLSPEERAQEEARAAAMEEAAARMCEEEERSYEEMLKAAEQAVEQRHLEIGAHRKEGIIGTMTEVGHPYGLSGVAVGRILAQHGLREPVDVSDDRFLSPVTVALEKFGKEQRERWRVFNASFRPNHKVDANEEREQPKLRRSRGVVDGFAIFDHFSSREYWIAAKVAPLLERHAKRGRPG